MMRETIRAYDTMLPVIWESGDPKWHSSARYMANDGAFGLFPGVEIHEEHIQTAFDYGGFSDLFYGITRRLMIHSALNFAAKERVNNDTLAELICASLQLDARITIAWREYQITMRDRYPISDSAIHVASVIYDFTAR